MDGTENVDELSLQSFDSLEDMINSKRFQEPINVPVDKSVGDIILMVLKYALVHALSLTEITELFMLINCIFKSHILPNTRYLIDKIFYPRNCTELHATCTECGAYIGKFMRKDRSLNCEVCKAKIDVKDCSYKDFFVMLDIASPISKLIETNSKYYNYIVNERLHEKGHIRDIYDGKRYREFVKSLSTEDQHRYATVTFNTDGAPLFKSSNYSIWPIYVMVNELPYNIRTKELILVGLWFGKNKPNMNVFLCPFVEKMYSLSSTGVQCLINGIELSIKIFALICCVDSVARAPVQGFVQFNGSYGCNQCLHPGVSVKSNPKNKRSGNIKYPLLNTMPKERNVKDTLKHMEEAATSKKSVFGVKGPSQLINLMYFNIIFGVVGDSMHCFTGVSKQFATTWFGNAKKSGLFSKRMISEIDTLLRSLKAPHQIVRLTRMFSDKEFWKAREWENWTLFYSLPILRNILPTKFLLHWALFVEATYLLLKDDVQVYEIDLADQLFHKFVGETEMLYSKVSMTYNVHLLLHMARSVYDWGPLWSHNAYAFESGNGQLLKVIQAAKGVHHQICRRISLQYSMLILKDRIYPECSSTVKHFCNNIGVTMVQKTLRISTTRYFGSGFSVNKDWVEKLNLSEQALSYHRIVKSGCLYMASIRNNKRSDNSFAQLRDSSYVKLINFIVDSNTEREYTIVQKIQTENLFPDNSCNILQKILEINEASAIPTGDIARVCVHVVNNSTQYLCTVPNLYFY